MTTKEQAIAIFCAEYVKLNNLTIKPESVRFIVEGKTIETHNAFYLRDTQLRIAK